MHKATKNNKKKREEQGEVVLEKTQSEEQI